MEKVGSNKEPTIQKRKERKKKKQTERYISSQRAILFHPYIDRHGWLMQTNLYREHNQNRPE